MSRGPVLVTGATGGIGAAVVSQLVDAGFSVLAQGRSAEKLAGLFGGAAGVVPVAHDLADVASLAGFVKGLVGEHGPLRGLVHAAGFDHLAPLYLAKPADARALFEIHALVPMTLAGLLAKRGQAAAGCAIVLISSLAAHEGAAGHTAYAAAKGALEGFLPSAAAELAARGIRLNVVAPGVVETEMSAGFLGRMTAEQRAGLDASYPLGIGTPDDVAAPIVFLLGDGARWITGQTLVLDGGHLVRSA